MYKTAPPQSTQSGILHTQKENGGQPVGTEKKKKNSTNHHLLQLEGLKI